LTKIELPHDILSLKQQAQRIEKEYWRLWDWKNIKHTKVNHQNYSRFLTETLKAKWSWSEVFQALNGNTELQH
jgi:hypothetical protein